MLYPPDLHPVRQGEPVGKFFVFRNKRADRIKLLYWDEDGYVIVYKRLKAGSFRFPTADSAGVEIRAADQRHRHSVYREGFSQSDCLLEWKLRKSHSLKNCNWNRSMATDPALIRIEPHTEIGLLLQRDADIVLERWSWRAVQEQPHAQRLHHNVLIDHLRELLQAIGRSLAESEHEATYQHCMPATVHGETRWEAGWSLHEVVRDYQILRIVVLDYLDKVWERPLGTHAVLAIGLALDEAIAASVAMYTASKEEHLRQLEAERAKQDKQIQRQLKRQADVLRAVDRRKNEFLAILGHELRNPLAALWNVVQLEQQYATTDQRWLQTRAITKRQVEQLERLADDLLDTARIAQGKVELRKQRLDLRAVAAQAVQTCASRLQARRHCLHTAFPEEPLWLDADSARLMQIVVNLLDNAAKYTEPEGQVWLTVACEDAEAVIRVRDTGIGIPQDLLPHVFELFTQADWSSQRSQGGMGIGLALVRQLVEMHGGTIAVRSAGEGHGSEFIVRLPTTSVPSSAWQPTDSDGTPANVKAPQRRILIVDDNVDAAQSLAMVLSLEGHEVQAVHDGRAALRAAAAAVPEIVLLDIGLPYVDGYEVARQLREQFGKEKLVLVAMTGYGQDEDRRRSQEAGFNAHLVKPVDWDALRQLLAHSVSRFEGQGMVE